MAKMKVSLKTKKLLSGTALNLKEYTGSNPRGSARYQRDRIGRHGSKKANTFRVTKLRLRTEFTILYTPLLSQ